MIKSPIGTFRHFELCSICLKGQCHEIFLLCFFSGISFPPAPEYSVETVSNFFENSQRYSRVKCTTGINDTGGKFATGINNTGGKIAAGINDTGGKFATGISDTGGKFATGVNDTGGKFATGVNDAGGKLPPVSTTPAVSLTPVK
jgi:hypothetical protein